MVLQGASTAELKAAAIKQGMSTLRMSGIRKVLDGMTTTGRDPARHDGGLSASPTKSDRRRTTRALKVNLHQLLTAMIEKGASDLHITDRLAAAPAHRRLGRAAQAAAALARRDEAALLLGPDRRAEDPVREEQRARSLVRREEPVALPRQHLHAARRRRGRVPLDPVQDPDASRSSACRRSSPSSRPSRAASCSSRARPAPARPRRSRRSSTRSTARRASTS